MNETLSLWQQKVSWSPTELVLIVCRIFQQMILQLKQIRKDGENNVEKKDFRKDAQVLKKVQKIILHRMKEDLSIEDLARLTGSSSGHLRNLFRQKMGISLGRFMKKQKINRALTLKREKKIPLSEVARLCGFGSIYSFSRAFKSLMGNPPSFYWKKAN